LVHDHRDIEQEMEKYEYFEARNVECAYGCRKHYQIYKSTKFCVKNASEFEEFEHNCKNPGKNPVINKPSSNYTRVIILCILNVLIVAFAAQNACYKHKKCSEADQKVPNAQASKVELTKKLSA
jgi:hypothetical protein